MTRARGRPPAVYEGPPAGSGAGGRRSRSEGRWLQPWLPPADSGADRLTRRYRVGVAPEPREIEELETFT
jgi:hypothetical protein